MLALSEYEAGICACGLHESVADKDPDGEMFERFCPTCASMARNLRILEHRETKEVERMGKNPPPESPRPSDGLYRGFRLTPPPST